MSKAPIPQLLPGRRNMAAHCSGCVFTAVSVHLDGLNAEDKFRVWVTILGHTPLPFPLSLSLIHFKVIHRAYITPYKRFKMKLQSNFNCHICNTASSGTFLHMFWECPIVISLWTHVNLVLSSLLQIDWTIIQNWFTPHMCGKTYWIHSLLQIVTCECTTA